MSGIVSFSFRSNLTVLKFVGLYPSKKFPVLHKVYGVALFVLSLTLPFVFGILHFVFVEDLAALSYNDYILVAMMFTSFKFLPFLRNGGEIRKCVEYFDDYVIMNADQRLIIEECASTIKRNTTVFISGCCVVYVGFIGQMLVQGKIEKLPLHVWLPSVWEETRVTFRCVYFLLIIGLAYATAACSTIDPLVGGLVHHASAQLQILSQCCQFLHRYGNLSNKRKIYRNIKLCIRHYQHIATFVDRYQDCFSPIVFSQFMCSVLVIGLCCFQLIVMKFDINLLVTLSGLGLLFFQIFFYCYYGTLLMEENDSFFRSLYMSRWYEYDEQSKKALLVLMERLQKPLIITAGKILTVSLETFTMILKRSYSFAAVLRDY